MYDCLIQIWKLSDMNLIDYLLTQKHLCHVSELPVLSWISSLNCCRNCTSVAKLRSFHNNNHDNTAPRLSPPSVFPRSFSLVPNYREPGTGYNWAQRFFFIFHCMRAAREPRSGEREYKTSRPNTTPTVRGICTFAVCFSVFRPFKFCEGHFALCYKEKTRAVRSCYGKYLRVVSLSLTPLLFVMC